VPLPLGATWIKNCMNLFLWSATLCPRSFTAGSGPGLAAPPRYPENAHEWRRIAPELAKHNGGAARSARYGDSSKPADGETTLLIRSERRRRQVEVMASLGFEKGGGHDRGGRVAHRMAVDHRIA